jgi:hypothetical protein
MTPRGFDQPLYVQPFDHRGSFETGMFGWKGEFSAEQTAQIAAAKQDVRWRDKKESREDAVAEIARRYREFVNVFDDAGAAASAA